MLRKLFWVVFAGVALFSCNKEKAVERVFSKEEIKHKVDSIATVRKKEIEENAKRDLNLRKKIQVKLKADSLVDAKLNPKPQPPAPVNVPPPPQNALRPHGFGINPPPTLRPVKK